MNSIILPTYCPVPSVEEQLKVFLQGLEQNTVLPYELVVVEQGKQVFPSIPYTSGKLLEAGEWPEAAKYFHQEQPMGYAKAVNKGVEMSSGEWLFIVNNDIKVPYGWDDKLLKAYQRLPKGKGLLSPIERGRGVEKDDFILNESWWSCVLIHRSVWDEVGRLDDEVLNYRFHDQDWSIRCRRAGYDVARYRGVVIDHIESSTYRHMNIDEGPERAEMLRRHGALHFHELVSQHRI